MARVVKKEGPILDTALVPDIMAWQRRFVILPSRHHELISATFCVHTWAFHTAVVTPYLYVYSKDPGSGKTRYLDTLAALVRAPRRAENMTPVVMFELIERECSTLLIDESDTIWSGSRNEPLRNVVNTGYKKGGCAYRIRAREVKEFSTFAAKVLAGINNGFMPATVRDRCIPFELKKRAKGQRVERFNETKIKDDSQLKDLHERIFYFVEHFSADLTAMVPEPMESLSDRQDEISEPLLAIAAVLGYEDELREALEFAFTTGEKKKVDPTTIIMGRIQDAFAGRHNMWSEELVEALGPMYTQHQLARWLAPFGIKTKNVRRGQVVKKGYTADQFMEQWSKTIEREQATPLAA